MIGWNPRGDYPDVEESSYIHISAVKKEMAEEVEKKNKDLIGTRA